MSLGNECDARARVCVRACERALGAANRFSISVYFHTIFPVFIYCVEHRKFLL